MKTYELKAARVRLGYTAQAVADYLGVVRQTYVAKERGIRSFSDKEKLMLTDLLKLTYDQFNLIFYNGELPYGHEAVD